MLSEITKTLLEGLCKKHPVEFYLLVTEHIVAEQMVDIIDYLWDRGEISKDDANRIASELNQLRMEDWVDILHWMSTCLPEKISAGALKAWLCDFGIGNVLCACFDTQDRDGYDGVHMLCIGAVNAAVGSFARGE